jgi:hypothetical protein
MTSDTAPAKPSVSFTITPGEFQLLATFMAPMQFNESTGASIWVASHGGWREWLVTANGITTVVFSREDELGRYGIEQDEAWAFPIPEHVLVTMGKFSMSLSDSLSDSSSGDMNVTLSDDWVTLTSNSYSMSVSQNPNAKCPPMIPHVESLLVANVDPTALWTMLSSARVWPTGGIANGMNTPMRTTCDFTRKQLVLQADWTVVDAGVHEYRMPAEFEKLPEGVELKPFNIPHSSILKLLRDPMAAEKFGPIKMHIAPEGVGHMKLSGENWAIYVPTIPNVQQWGHDLDEVVGDIHRSAWDLTGLTIDQFFLGIIFLDHQGENASLSPVNAEQANQYRLTLAEMQAYNHAVVNGDLEAIFQQAAQELNRDSTHDQAKGVMQGLLSALPSDAHIAVNKISQYLVTRK